MHQYKIEEIVLSELTYLSKISPVVFNKYICIKYDIPIEKIRDVIAKLADQDKIIIDEDLHILKK